MKPNPVWEWKAYWPISVYYPEMDDVFIKHNDKKWAVCHMVPISIATNHSGQVSLEAQSEAPGQKLACHKVKIGTPDVSIEKKLYLKLKHGRI